MKFIVVIMSVIGFAGLAQAEEQMTPEDMRAQMKEAQDMMNTPEYKAQMKAAMQQMKAQGMDTGVMEKTASRPMDVKAMEAANEPTKVPEFASVIAAGGAPV